MMIEEFEKRTGFYPTQVLYEAIERAYAAAKPISFQDMHFRTDIGKI